MGCVQGSKAPFEEQSYCDYLVFYSRIWQSFLGWFYEGVLESGRFSHKATRNSYVTRSEFHYPFLLSSKSMHHHTSTPQIKHSRMNSKSHLRYRSYHADMLTRIKRYNKENLNVIYVKRCSCLAKVKHRKDIPTSLSSSIFYSEIQSYFSF